MKDFSKYKKLCDMQSMLKKGTRHFDAVLCPAGLYIEYRDGHNFMWELTIDNETISGEDMSDLMSYIQKIKSSLAKIESNKKNVLICYVYRLNEVHEFFKHHITAGDEKHNFEVVVDDCIVLRGCDNIAPLSCLDDLSNDFLKRKDLSYSQALALFGKEAFESFLVDDDRVHKVFKTAASMAKYEISKSLPAYHKSWMADIVPYQDIYHFIRYKCFRASLCMTGKLNSDMNDFLKYTSIMKDDVVSYDQSSAHAHKLVCKDFPISKPMEVDVPKDISSILKEKWCWLEIEFEGVSSFEDTRGLDPFKIRGRKDITLCMDHLQLEAFKLFYYYDKMTVKRLIVADKGKLPMWARKAIAKLYLDKAAYPTKDAKRNFLKVKLNSGSYGVTVERLYDYWKDDEETIPKTYTNSKWQNVWKNRLLPPQVGVSITSYVFLDECRLIAADPDAFVYCDTDSVKSEQSSTAFLKAVERRNKESYKEVADFCKKSGFDYELMKELGAYQLDAYYMTIKAISPKEYIYLTEKGYGATTAGYASHYDAHKEWSCEKKHVPVALYEPMSQGIDPFDYFTFDRHFKDYKNLWIADKLTCYKAWFDLTIDENSKVEFKLSKMAEE